MKSEKISNQCYFHYYHLCYCCCYCQCLHNDNVYSIILVILLLVSISISLPYDLLPTAFYGLLKYFFNVFFSFREVKQECFANIGWKKLTVFSLLFPVSSTLSWPFSFILFLLKELFNGLLWKLQMLRVLSSQSLSRQVPE